MIKVSLALAVHGILKFIAVLLFNEFTFCKIVTSFTADLFDLIRCLKTSCVARLVDLHFRLVILKLLGSREGCHFPPLQLHFRTFSTYDSKFELLVLKHKEIHNRC